MLEIKNDNIRERGMLILLGVSPLIIGFFYNVMLQIPVIGSIWMYAAPFTLLYYWGWVGNVFQSRIKKAAKAVLLGNLAGLVCLLIFIWQCLLVSEENINSFLYILSQMFTLPLGFITMWIGLVIEGNTEMLEISRFTMVCTQVCGLLLMLVAFTVGFYYSKNKEKKANMPKEVTDNEPLIKIKPLSEDEYRAEKNKEEND